MVFLGLIWSDSPNRELIWFLLPFAGLFRQIGGTWKKAVGRFFTPLAIGMAYFFFIGWSLWIVVIFGAFLAIKTLPFTLIGDDVDEHWLNWAWIWVLGFLNGVVCLSIAIPLGMWLDGLILSLVPLLVYGVCGTFSNLAFSRNWFVWKLCEFLFGVAAIYPALQLIQQYSPVTP